MVSGLWRLPKQHTNSERSCTSRGQTAPRDSIKFKASTRTQTLACDQQSVGSSVVERGASPISSRPFSHMYDDVRQTICYYTKSICHYTFVATSHRIIGSVCSVCYSRRAQILNGQRSERHACRYAGIHSTRKLCENPNDHKRPICVCTVYATSVWWVMMGPNVCISYIC